MSHLSWIPNRGSLHQRAGRQARPHGHVCYLRQSGHGAVQFERPELVVTQDLARVQGLGDARVDGMVPRLWHGCLRYPCAKTRLHRAELLQSGQHSAFTDPT